MAKPDPHTKQNADPVRIVLIDDHPLLRERLREMIETDPAYSVCGEAEDRAGALKVIAAAKPDLAIVDLSLKQSSGLELIKDLQARQPRLKILVLSMHEETIYAERAIRAGASGYITKQQAGSQVMEAIKRVLAGESFLPPEVVQVLLAQRLGRSTAEDRSGIESLSDRELEVFRCLAKGLTIREIAVALKLDVKTIETYRARLKEKLGLRTAQEVAQAAIRWGHTQPDL